MLSRESVRARLAELLAQIGRIPVDRITETATIEDELQMSSLGFVELQVALEDEYGVQLDPIRVVELSSFGAITDYVHGLALAADAA